MYTKLNSLDTTIQELERRVSETSDSFHEHTVGINEVLLWFFFCQDVRLWIENLEELKKLHKNSKVF